MLAKWSTHKKFGWAESFSSKSVVAHGYRAVCSIQCLIIYTHFYLLFFFCLLMLFIYSRFWRFRIGKPYSIRVLFQSMYLGTLLLEYFAWVLLNVMQVILSLNLKMKFCLRRHFKSFSRCVFRLSFWKSVLENKPRSAQREHKREKQYKKWCHTNTFKDILRMSFIQLNIPFKHFIRIRTFFQTSCVHR